MHRVSWGEADRWQHDNATCRGLCRHANFCQTWYQFNLDLYLAIGR